VGNADLDARLAALELRIREVDVLAHTLQIILRAHQVVLPTEWSNAERAARQALDQASRARSDHSE
jgi:hypothetical protein